MKKMMIGILVSLTMASASAQSAFTQGSLVFAMESQEREQVLLGGAYLVGVVDALRDYIICPPKMKPSDMMYLFRTYAKQNKHNDDQQAEFAIVTAFSQSFPCRKNTF